MTELLRGQAAGDRQAVDKVPESEARDHPYDKVDRAMRASLARATAGVSPHSIMATWMDWAVHLSRSPGRQLELVERATRNASKLWAHATDLAMGKSPEPPFHPRAQDHRFAADEWRKTPFAAWQQAFLSTQDWWQAATEEMPGIAPRDAERAQFQVRQALDLISPSNFPWSNPEIIKRTLQTGGRNLVEGGTHFLEDLARTATQQQEPAPACHEIGN
ncbi:poly-beta-hydroxybutyrate polymerase N-terminal domain-containing protein [Ruegeria sp. 2205SS24-7]|uniref:poly-beta-hydroxybutyrate polymerase N-terminal domain-containing protein n=1 Tax=Ruegeria discodermiae TaxID=3064389 RepID=UPI00274273EA|nr:poly-beta-hydroxybutyrate polymerase N-terminal domain-containing protein [Ruegeria sp. 2205SS24-7]MDP5220078.1 poly-beta-hydroxybutyrate polymerase N-terminal domain-containing protein [Ruegeria sp. 2205SS24-7]